MIQNDETPARKGKKTDAGADETPARKDDPRAEMNAILREITAKRAEIEVLEARRQELAETLYAEQREDDTGVNHFKRAQDISALLRQNKTARDDAAEGRMRQMQRQMAEMSAKGKGS